MGDTSIYLPLYLIPGGIGELINGFTYKAYIMVGLSGLVSVSVAIFFGGWPGHRSAGAVLKD